MQSINFLTRSQVAERFKGKSVAIVGSGPGCLDNEPGFIDSHDVVVRVNNYKTSERAGFRTDVYYSFFGYSIKKTARELKRDGVTLCMCKCPDEHAIHSPWHIENNRLNGVDFRYIYRHREGWWFCDTYIPDASVFVEKYRLLDSHVPTTGFAAILDVMSFEPKSIYLTGFDFFQSGVHNVNEFWDLRNPDDPIAHVPDKEREWLAANPDSRLSFDPKLDAILKGKRVSSIDPEEFKARALSLFGPGILRLSALSLRNGADIIAKILAWGDYKHVLEIGTFKGLTASFMSHFVPRVTTIDLRNGRLEAVDPGFDRVDCINKMGAGNIDLRLVKSDRRKAQLIKSLEFDFAFIDGNHTAPAPEIDFDLVKKCGTVLFHDYDEDNPNGVVQFVKTLPRHEVEVTDIFALWRRS